MRPIMREFICISIALLAGIYSCMHRHAEYKGRENGLMLSFSCLVFGLVVGVFVYFIVQATIEQPFWFLGGSRHEHL